MSAIENSNPNIKAQGANLGVHRSNPPIDLKFKKTEKLLSIKSSTHSPKSLDFHLNADNNSPIDFSANNSNPQPIRITTSKKWVLPPRPKPGRKPSSISNSCCNNNNDNNTASATNGSTSHCNDSNHNNNKRKLKKSEFIANRNLQKKPVHSLSSVSNIKIMPKSNINSLNLDPKSHSSIPTPSPTPGSLSPNHQSQLNPNNNANLTTSLNLNSSHSSSPISIPASPDKSKSSPSPIGSVSPPLIPNEHLSKNDSQKFQKKLQSKQIKQIKLLPTPMSISNSSSNSTLTSLSNKTTINDLKTKSTKFKPNKNLINSKQSNHLSGSKMIEIDSSIVNNPIKQEILKINEENYYLKLEVIRLVSNLKNLRDEVQPIVEKNKSLKMTTNTSTNDTGEKSKVFRNPLSCSLSAASSNSLSSISSPKSLPIELINQNNLLDNEMGTNNKKRSHDEDINDLIVSLIDLNHSQQVENPSLELIENKNKNLCGNTRKKNNDIENYLSFKDDDKLLDLSEEDDLISTVSTTPSTMLSLIATNETMDSISCGTSLIGSNDDFDFKLIDIPTTNRSDSITDPTISITNNNDNNLNTLSTVNEITDFEMVGSLDLVNQKSKVDYISDSLDSLYSNEYFEFNGNDKAGVDLEFDSFINGKNLDV